MANGNMLGQLREMADRKEIAPEQAFPLMMAAMADIYEEQLNSKVWRKETEERIDNLEHKDAKFTAIVAAAASIMSSGITAVITWIVANSN